jgi:hypothetical protein
MSAWCPRNAYPTAMRLCGDHCSPGRLGVAGGAYAFPRVGPLQRAALLCLFSPAFTTLARWSPHQDAHSSTSLLAHTSRARACGMRDGAWGVCEGVSCVRRATCEGGVRAQVQAADCVWWLEW